MNTTIDEIRDDFALLDDWEDRYRYLIELGKRLPDMPESLKTEQTKVRGCASQVWLASKLADGNLSFQGDSDAHIVRGLIAILFAIYNKRAPNDILQTDAHAVFTQLGLAEHLTQQRSNGFASMVERIRSDANALVGSAAAATK